MVLHFESYMRHRAEMGASVQQFWGCHLVQDLIDSGSSANVSKGKLLNTPFQQIDLLLVRVSKVDQAAASSLHAFWFESFRHEEVHHRSSIPPADTVEYILDRTAGCRGHRSIAPALDFPRYMGSR